MIEAVITTASGLQITKQFDDLARARAWAYEKQVEYKRSVLSWKGLVF